MTPLRFWACWLSLLVKMAGVAPLLALSPPRAVSMADAHGDSAAGSSVPDRKAVIDILLGRISLSGAWDPYATATAIGTSTQVRLGDSPFWADGSLIVAWGGELGPEGGRAGPGTSFVELQAGVGHRWSLESTPFTLYVGAGLTTIFANLELPDRSRAPLPNPYRPSEPIYPEISQDGYFWGDTAAGVSPCLSRGAGMPDASFSESRPPVAGCWTGIRMYVRSSSGYLSGPGSESLQGDASHAQSAVSPTR